MNCALPVVTRAGHFESRLKLPGMTETTPRVLGAYELELFTADSGTAHLGGETRSICKGDVVLAKPGSVRWSILPVQCHFVHFATDDEELIRFLDGMIGFGHTDRYGQVEAMFLGIRETFIMVDALSESVTAARLLELLWQLRRYIQPAAEECKKDPVRKALGIIQADFREEITVEQLAEKCNLSVSYFHKLFVQTTGVTPNRYLIMTRLAAAKTLLLSGDRPISQVAEYCGFSSQGYFCDCMKKYTGMSPSQFRRNANYPEKK